MRDSNEWNFIAGHKSSDIALNCYGWCHTDIRTWWDCYENEVRLQHVVHFTKRSTLCSTGTGLPATGKAVHCRHRHQQRGDRKSVIPSARWQVWWPILESPVQSRRGTTVWPVKSYWRLWRLWSTSTNTWMGNSFTCELTIQHLRGCWISIIWKDTARWVQRLQEYHFTSENRQGLEHTNADALSRRPCTKECKHCRKVEQRADIPEVRVVATTPADGWECPAMRREQLKDDDDGQLLR